MNTNRRRMLLSAGAAAVAGSESAKAERVHAIRLKFDIEAKVPLTAILTPEPLTFPPEVGSALAAGALETRVRYRFPLGGLDVLGIHVFLVPPVVPYPMPEPPPPTDQATVAYFEVAIHDVLTVDRPNASVALVGEVVRTTGSPFGDLTGVLSYASFQYSAVPPVRFRAVLGGSAGVITTNAPAGVGSMEWNFRMP